MEKHYCIDPGQGSKMDGCPYSVFEDGHDVQEYIVPPKGHVFIGFKFEPLRNNQIYEGKLVAQYEKSSIKERITSNIWKILIPIIITAVIGFVVLLVVSIFKNPKPSKPEPKNPETETVVTQIDTTPPEVFDPLNQTEYIVPENTGETLYLTEKTDQQEEITVAEPQETPQPKTKDPNVQFKQEFWTLIHDGVIMMDPYHELYVNYKGKVEGEEFEYLRLTILKDYVSFKEWYEKLKRIPEKQRQSISSVDELAKKMNE